MADTNDKVTSGLTNYHVYFENGYINYESISCMFLSPIIWRVLYYIFRCIFYEQSPEFSARLISFLHGVIAAFMGINQCFLIDWPFDHPEWKTSYIQSFIMTTSMGYFIHDLIWMFKYDSKDKTMIFHHIVCIWALCRMTFKGYSGAQATCALGSMELTNPFLQARWFLRTAQMQFSPIYVSTEITFFLIFVTIRIIIGSYFLNIILKQTKNDWDFLLMSVAIYVISWVFLWGMIKYVLRKYIRGNRNRKE